MSWSNPRVRLPEMKPRRITETQTAIARNVATLIEDGSVLQTGIGGIPDAVLSLLMDRKDLGVHSELVSDGVIPLIEAGVITGELKNFKPRKIIVGFVLGTKRMFDFVDNNPIPAASENLSIANWRRYSSILSSATRRSVMVRPDSSAPHPGGSPPSVLPAS